MALMTAAPEIAWGLLVRAPETDAKFPEVLALCAPTTYVGRYPDRHRPFDAGADLVGVEQIDFDTGLRTVHLVASRAGS